MATYTVGDDYTSSAIQTAIDLIPGNLSGHGKEWVQVYSKSGGYVETLDLSDGFSSGSAADYICCEAMVSHGGIREQGIVIDGGSEAVDYGALIGSPYTQFIGFCLTRSSFKAGSWNSGVKIFTDHSKIIGNIVYDIKSSDSQGASGIRMQWTGGVNNIGNRIINNQCIYLGTPGGGSVDGWGSGIYIYESGTAGNEQIVIGNTLLSGTAQGIVVNGRDYVFACNNYAGSFDDVCFSTSGSSNVYSYNISSDATADDDGGDGNLINKAAADQFVSVTAGSEDLHLKATADCFRNGADMSAYFTHDCVNIPRKFWRTGAFETLPTVYSVNDGNPHKVYYSWGGNLAKVDGVDVPLRNTETMTDNDAATVAVGFSPVYGQEFGGLVGDLKIFDQSDAKDMRP